MAVYLFVSLVILSGLFYTAALAAAQICRGGTAAVCCAPLTENDAEYILRTLLFLYPRADIIVPSGCGGENIARILARTEDRITVM